MRRVSLTKLIAARNDCAGDLSVTSDFRKRWKFATRPKKLSGQIFLCDFYHKAERLKI